MLRVGLTAAPKNKGAIEARQEALRWLKAHGCSIVSENDYEAKHPDVLVALGGDGTIMRCAEKAAVLDVPMLGINLGTVGFLAEMEPEGLTAALDRLLQGDYTEERRALLSVCYRESRFLALNDAVISRGAYPRLIRVQARLDDAWAGDYRADGLVVATPTGSTGYSLSAGGPIIAPGVDCMLITPICPHSLQHRPQVVPGNASVTLTLQADEPIVASLQVDGQHCAHLREGDTVTIGRAKEEVRLIRMREKGFFDLVHQKLIEWSR